ncbi:hypothetical protein MSAN_01810700 [Mycena sanguinolenta]|uniref:Uncharacterized protein n=1 Tax=Mycena sanguinolenta TaxID=230812 RepID=A0A8H6XU17_9AGAR|nr:hypothetical protein MSAN_01810700 [Mycena sanguinolenta]
MPHRSSYCGMEIFRLAVRPSGLYSCTSPSFAHALQNEALTILSLCIILHLCCGVSLRLRRRRLRPHWATPKSSTIAYKTCPSPSSYSTSTPKSETHLLFARRRTHLPAFSMAAPLDLEHKPARGASGTLEYLAAFVPAARPKGFLALTLRPLSSSLGVASQSRARMRPAPSPLSFGSWFPYSETERRWCEGKLPPNAPAFVFPILASVFAPGYLTSIHTSSAEY